MKRTTIADLKAAVDRLTAVSSREYRCVTIGNGFWTFGEVCHGGTISLTDPLKLKDLVAFANAYCKGYQDGWDGYGERATALEVAG